MRVRTLVALLLFTLYPAAAHAWWWDYFDGLSGPGPFTTAANSPPVEVIWWLDPGAVLKEAEPNREDSKFLVLLDDPSQKGQWYLALRNVRLNNREHKQMFENQPNDRRLVNLTTTEISAMYRVNRVLDLGFGASFLKFSGEGFQPKYRMGPIAKMTVTPLGDFMHSAGSPGARRAFWLLRSPKIYVDYTIFGGLTPSDFGNPNGNPLPAVEGNVRAGVLIDGSALFCVLKGCRAR
jgi:hypothetical protein